MAKDIRKTAEWRKAERVYNQFHAASVFSVMGIGPVLRCWEEIDRELEELLEECPEYFPALFQRTEFMLRTGQSADGEEFLDRAFNCMANILKDEDEFISVFSQRVENLEKLLRYDLAVKYLEKAIHLFPGAAAFYDYSSFYSLLLPKCNPSNVIKMQLTALDLEPDNDCFISNLGWIHLMMGNYEDAEKYFKKAIEFNPQNPSAMDNLDIAEFMHKNKLTYFNYLLRPVNKETLDKFFKSGDYEEVTNLCRIYNTDRLDAFKIFHLQNNSLEPHEILNILHAFKAFMIPIEDIVGEEIFLYENVETLLKEAKYYFYQFIVRYDNTDEQFIEDVSYSLSAIYNFLSEKQLVSPSECDRFINRITPIAKEFSSKIEDYYKVRNNITLDEEEKEKIIEELFDL